MRLRTSSLVLLAVNAGLLAAIAWMTGTPVQPRWLAPQATAHAVTALTPLPPPELTEASRAAAWTRPLFSPDRQADPQPQGRLAQALSGLTLTGVVLDSTAHWAYLRQGPQPAMKVALGTTLASGWTLTQLGPVSATFTRDGHTHTLNMPVLRLPPPSKASALTLPRIKTP